MNSGSLRWFIIAAAASGVWAAGDHKVDSQRGAVLVEDAGCLECHTVWGQGAGHEPSGKAPELGANLARVYTAPALASAIWNHTPAMLAEMSADRLYRPALTAADWEDVFAYLYSLQFIEYPAEIGRGKEAFLAKECAGCHTVAGPALGAGKPVADWKPVDDPVALVYQMWSHASSMESAGREAPWNKSGWTKMTGRDFSDLTAYFQNLQGLPRQIHFSLPEPSAGKAAFDHNCGSCHAGPLALETSLSNTTWMDIGAGMWNHVMLMRGVPVVNEQDMRGILAYVWELQYRGPQGDVEQGRLSFAAKGCSACHDAGSTGKAVTPATIAAIGWGEGRRMHQDIAIRGAEWPQLSAQDVADIAAFMNSRGGMTARSGK